jgi:hypothetical protein
MNARLNSSQMSESCGDPNRAVAAHSEVSNVIEKDHSCCAIRGIRLQQPRAYHYIGTARLAQDRTTRPVVIAPEPLHPLR